MGKLPPSLSKKIEELFKAKHPGLSAGAEIVENVVVVEADAFKETYVIYRALILVVHHNDVIQTTQLVTHMKVIRSVGESVRGLMNLNLQDDEVGVGTTSMVVWPGELLREAEKLLTMKFHPMTIIANDHPGNDPWHWVDHVALKMDALKGGRNSKWKNSKGDPRSLEKIYANASGKFSTTQSTIDAEINASINTLEKMHRRNEVINSISSVLSRGSSTVPQCLSEEYEDHMRRSHEDFQPLLRIFIKTIFTHEEPGALYRHYQLTANQNPIRMDKSDAWRSVA
ncbi:putative polyprotein [Tanacetum coccineum]